MADISHEVVFDQSEVDDRLESLGLTREIVLSVRDRAFQERSRWGALAPPAMKAICAWGKGTEELREQAVRSESWGLYDINGIRGVERVGNGCIVLVQNVDVACSKLDAPRALSAKGPASQQLSLFQPGELPPLSCAIVDGVAISKDVWRIMIDWLGRVEVTLAAVDRYGNFCEFRTRLLVNATTSDDHATTRLAVTA